MKVKHGAGLSALQKKIGGMCGKVIRGIPQLARLSVPYNISGKAATASQIFYKNRYAAKVQEWRAATPAQRAAWDLQGEPLNISGFNYLMMVSEMNQTDINPDETEATTLDNPIVSLQGNMNRIRHWIIALSGEAWGTVTTSTAALAAKFHATTGHKHTGTAGDGPVLTIPFSASPENSMLQAIESVFVGIISSFGLAWSDLGQRGAETYVRSLAYLGNGIAVAGTIPNGKIFRSVNYGATWSDLGQQGTETQVRSLAYLGNGIVVAGTYPTGKIFRSTNYGLTWTDLGRQGAETYVFSLAYLGNGIAVAGTYPNGKIFRSVNYGATWSDLGQPGAETGVYSLADLGNGIAVAGTYPNGKIGRAHV